MISHILRSFSGSVFYWNRRRCVVVCACDVCHVVVTCHMTTAILSRCARGPPPAASRRRRRRNLDKRRSLADRRNVVDADICQRYRPRARQSIFTDSRHSAVASTTTSTTTTTATTTTTTTTTVDGVVV